jgi:hypothetical protein
MYSVLIRSNMNANVHLPAYVRGLNTARTLINITSWGMYVNLRKQLYFQWALVVTLK